MASYHRFFQAPTRRPAHSSKTRVCHQNWPKYRELESLPLGQREPEPPGTPKEGLSAEERDRQFRQNAACPDQAADAVQLPGDFPDIVAREVNEFRQDLEAHPVIQALWPEWSQQGYPYANRGTIVAELGTVVSMVFPQIVAIRRGEAVPEETWSKLAATAKSKIAS